MVYASITIVYVYPIPHDMVVGEDIDKISSMIIGQLIVNPIMDEPIRTPIFLTRQRENLLKSQMFGHSMQPQIDGPKLIPPSCWLPQLYDKFGHSFGHRGV